MKKIAVILAAGKGVRMKGELPKVFHNIAGKPMLEYVLDAAEKVDFDEIFAVVGHKSEVIIEYFRGRKVTFVEQAEQLGTGHAVMQVEPFIKEKSLIIVLSGDMPFITDGTINKLIQTHLNSGAKATIVTAVLKDPGHYGRVVKGVKGEVKRVIEAKDADSDEKAITEINSGIYCFESQVLFDALKGINRDNAQGEYYLTDVIGIIVGKGMTVKALVLVDPTEAMGINTPEELREAEVKMIALRKGS